MHNPAGVLSAEDEARMLRDADRLEIPAVVTQLNYLVFAENNENVNDTVEEFARDSAPELISDDDEHFSDGTLIVGVGLDPRQSFVFAGEDVADALYLNSGSHLDEAVTAIQPGVVDDNIPAGLFAGANAATDTEALAQDLYEQDQSNRTAAIIGGSVGAAGLLAALSAGGGAMLRAGRKKVLTARYHHDLVSKEYGSLAQRLDQIDIRAHSLASPFADNQMRQQWEQVRDHFLQLHDHVDGFSQLNEASPDKDFLAVSTELADAAAVTQQVSYAEENIDSLFKLEHGDEALRRSELAALREDVIAAQLEIGKEESELSRRLKDIEHRADALSLTAEQPEFLDHFVVLLSDYRLALNQLKSQKFSDVEASSELAAPAIYERNYRPGYGYHDFVPFWALSTWHMSNVQAHESAQAASSTNTSFSSGFSGAGGSSSF
ncbi:DUF5129 domain-containing protein [Corynebacterium alimapuense]|uniref:DUF5129 domain-containing protein n=1 Tax=Corynebacterium alimapuense TaxID=1576874 RepID=A0A3M8K945_9CORY|nr:DUF5129 domain-containing protein [Corynebacterium alimapuense]